MQIILDTRGLQLSVRNACFAISAGSETRIVHPRRVDSFLVTAPCRISSPALVLAAENQIPVVICNGSGKPEARLWSPRFLNTSALRRQQYRFCEKHEALQWAERIIRAKIAGQQDNLLFMAGRKTSLVGAAAEAVGKIDAQLATFSAGQHTDLATGKKQLLFREAYAAAMYWQLVGTRLPEPFAFDKRVKRNPADAFNACINYLYGMLRNQAETAVLSYGLDPALGIMHRDGYCMPSLVFDIMEPYRPVVDRLLLAAVLQGQLPADLMMGENGKPRINKDGRHKLIEMFVQKLHARATLNGIAATLNNHLLNEAKLLAETIRKV